MLRILSTILATPIWKQLSHNSVEVFSLTNVCSTRCRLSIESSSHIKKYCCTAQTLILVFEYLSHPHGPIWNSLLHSARAGITGYNSSSETMHAQKMLTAQGVYLKWSRHWCLPEQGSDRTAGGLGCMVVPIVVAIPIGAMSSLPPHSFQVSQGDPSVQRTFSSY